MLSRLRRALLSGVSDTLASLRFATILPIPVFAFERADGADLWSYARALRLLPLAGATVGALGATTLLAGLGLGLGPTLAAALAVATLAAATGGLHEDGLADCADSFGGSTRERRLEIMSDSRVGSYGALALGLSLILRVAAAATLAERDAGLAAAVLVAAGALSRGAGLAPLALLPPARDRGLAHSAGRPTPRNVAAAAALGALACALPLAFGAPLAQAALALGLVVAAVACACALARRRLGGHTGDVAGATQQLAEIATLVAFCARP
ncbi:adenosylcobinamide-GDP ribazoletransferase [Methylocella sp.]|uniref:adenosylcobinamide-GDP ribazoletransferase n=1 Tax=Methylocella sp. TaxID=1978226 RepID=UPI00378472E4